MFECQKKKRVLWSTRQGTRQELNMEGVEYAPTAGCPSLITVPKTAKKALR